MEFIIAAVCLTLGFALGRWRQIHGYFKSKQLVRQNSPQPPPSRILKPFTKTAKHKPRVNDDERAWLAEKNR
jgi:hypothetical protein